MMRTLLSSGRRRRTSRTQSVADPTAAEEEAPRSKRNWYWACREQEASHRTCPAAACAAHTRTHTRTHTRPRQRSAALFTPLRTGAEPPACH
jgi:hypothetical protein